MTLQPSDHRCHDERCEVKEQCERWLQRDTGEAYTQHATTLRLGWECHDVLCDRAVKHRLTIDELYRYGPAGWLAAGWYYGHVPARIHRQLLKVVTAQ